jgi:hypothetical protein
MLASRSSRAACWSSSSSVKGGLPSQRLISASSIRFQAPHSLLSVSLGAGTGLRRSLPTPGIGSRPGAHPRISMLRGAATGGSQGGASGGRVLRIRFARRSRNYMVGLGALLIRSFMIAVRVRSLTEQLLSSHWLPRSYMSRDPRHQAQLAPPSCSHWVQTRLNVSITFPMQANDS